MPDATVNDGHLDKLTEAQFQQRILDLCGYLGLLVFHDNDSRRNHAGFPDLVIVGAGHHPAKLQLAAAMGGRLTPQLIFRELKTDTGRLRPEQVTWLHRLELAGADVGVWRPADWPRVQDELRALREPP